MASITGPGLALIQTPTTYQQGPLRLTSVFPVKDADGHSIQSGVTYEIDACGETYAEVDFDGFADCIRTAEKTFDEGLTFVDSIDGPLALLTALKCRPGAIGGGGFGDYETRARNRLHRVESRFLEDTLWTHINAGTSSTGATGVEATIAALLGAHIDDVNNPVLHLSVADAVKVAWKLDDYQAVFGLAIVVSPGYEDDTVGLTGSVNIWGGSVEVTTAPEETHNYIMAMAERMYTMTVECPAYFAAVA